MINFPLSFQGDSILLYDFDVTLFLPWTDVYETGPFLYSYYLFFHCTEKVGVISFTFSIVFLSNFFHISLRTVRQHRMDCSPARRERV